MQFCKSHWGLAREVIDTHGLSPLIAKDGEEAASRMVSELEGESRKENFDPLMSLNWHYCNIALKNGGLEMMSPKEDGTPRCPICEIEAHYSDFKAKDDFTDTATRMAEWARAEGLLPQVS